MQKQIAILLVLYNDEQHVTRLVQSLYNQTWRYFDIYAIETSESGKSCKLLKELFPESNIYPYLGNLGFAAGNNFLAEKAYKNGAVYLFVLNTDMELDENCLTELVQLSDSDPMIGGVAPIVLHGRNNTRTNEIQSYAENINFTTAVTVPIFQGKEISDDLCENYNVNIIHGGVTFLKRELYKQIGLFNEENFMYGDERDLAYKINKTNYKLVVTKKAISWHHHDRTVDNKTGFRREYYYRLRNRYLYFYSYRKYKSLLKELFKEIIKIPFVIRWTQKRKDLVLLKYYYLGILHGLQNRKGKANIKFG